jgi:hypothetical protein
MNAWVHLLFVVNQLELRLSAPHTIKAATPAIQARQLLQIAHTMHECDGHQQSLLLCRADFVRARDFTHARAPVQSSVGTGGACERCQQMIKSLHCPVGDICTSSTMS